MDKVLVKFWTKQGWHINPAACAIWLGLILGLGGFALKMISTVVAANSIPTLQIENKVLNTIEGVVGSRSALPKAQAAVKDEWLFPQCDNETSEERFRRLTKVALCFFGKMSAMPSEEDISKEISELDLGTAWGKQQKVTLLEKRTALLEVKAQRDKVLGEAGTTFEEIQKELKLRSKNGESWVEHLSPSPSCAAQDRWMEYGVDTEACTIALNDQVSFPVTTRSMIQSLQEMELTPLDFKDSAQAFVGAEDEGGWEYFPGGTLLQPYGPYRESIQRYLELSSNSEDSLRLPALRNVATRMLTFDKARHDTAEEVGETVQSAGYQRFGETVKFSGFLFLFFVALSVFWRASVLGTGWRRLLGFFGLAFTGIALLAPIALQALDLSAAKDAIGEPDGLGNAIGAPFAVLAQLMDLLQGWLTALWDVQTLKTLILVGLFGLIFQSTRTGLVVLAAYGVLLTKRWFSSGEFGVLPFDVHAFDAMIGVPLVGWCAELLGFAVAILLVRGLWSLIGERMIWKGTELLVPTGPSRAPQSGADSVAAPR